MNVRQKLSLAALCITLPAFASAQAAAPAAAPAAEPAAAPAAAPAPAISVKPYGFALLTYNQNNGTFAYPEYPSKISAEDVKTNSVSARQSRFGLMISGADAGVLGATLGGRLEFDFMGGIAGVDGDATPTKLKATPGSWDSSLLRLRYAVATAGWDLKAAGKVALTVGQTDGLVNPLHPELGAYIALPTFMQAGNLTRRSPQIRVGYSNAIIPMLDVQVEAAVLNAADAAGVAVSAGNTSGQPDVEARLQVAVKPMDDVKATVGLGYHRNKQTYDLDKATEQSLTSTLIGVDLNIEATKYLVVRGEWFAGKGSDESQTGAFTALDPANKTFPNAKLLKTTGYWAQAVVKPLPFLWVMAGYGQEKAEDANDFTFSMMNVGLLAPVGKNLRLGLEYTTSKAADFTSTTVTTPTDYSGSAVAFSSRFSF